MGELNGLPVEITPVEEELNRQLLQDFSGCRTGYVRVGPQGYLLSNKYVKEAENLFNFQPRPSDTWVATFPRSGTTWTQEIVWLIANQLDFETAKQIPQDERFPYFEYELLGRNKVQNELIQKNGQDKKMKNASGLMTKTRYQILEEMSGPRFIKTHLPFSLLPQNLLQVGCKVIYVARNPKDVAVSYFHFNRIFQTLVFRGDFTKFWDYFEKNLCKCTPYWAHLKEGWGMRNHPNVLFLFYEEMNKDVRKTINQVSEFLLGHQQSAEDIDRLANYVDISNFRKNPAVNRQTLVGAGVLTEAQFIRKGKTGGWVEEFSPELNKRADKWINDNLKDTDLRFPGMCSE